MTGHNNSSIRLLFFVRSECFKMLCQSKVTWEMNEVDQVFCKCRVQQIVRFLNKSYKYLKSFQNKLNIFPLVKHDWKWLLKCTARKMYIPELFVQIHTCRTRNMSSNIGFLISVKFEIEKLHFYELEYDRVSVIVHWGRYRHILQLGPSQGMWPIERGLSIAVQEASPCFILVPYRYVDSFLSSTIASPSASFVGKSRVFFSIKSPLRLDADVLFSYDHRICHVLISMFIDF